MSDRELMQQALDALEYVIESVGGNAPESFDVWFQKTQVPAEALRARLAQPEPTLALWNFKHNRLAGLSDDRAEVALIRQREWQGLTKEEARELCVANVPYVVDMVAALEARLKEKNT